MFGCYPKEMDVNQEDFHNLLVALSSGDEKEIFKVLYKKKEIDDKSPKLRTEDEKKKLKSLSNQMRKFPKNLIDGIQKKFPFLQRRPKTGEQRKEQKKECNRQKRAAQSQKEKEMRQEQDKEFHRQKRAAQSEIDGIQKKFPFLQRTPKTAEQRKEQVKECKRQKRAAESKIEQEMRLNKQKEFELERYTQSPQFRAKKVKEVSEKRLAESEKETERRLNKQKKYEHEKRAAESEKETERRLTKQKQYEHEKRRQPSKDWKQELIDKASLTHICTSECRYRPKGSMVVVRDKMFTSKQMRLLTINNETLSIDGKYYVCKSCKNSIQKNKIPPCNEISKKFMIDKLPEKFLTEKMSLSKLESHLLKLIIPFIRIAYIPGYGQYKVKGPMITVEADVTETLNEKILPRQQELIPVALKRKLSYKGTVMEEMVSKNKVQAYFDYFKQDNPLFGDEILHMERMMKILSSWLALR